MSLSFDVLWRFPGAFVRGAGPGQTLIEGEGELRASTLSDPAAVESLIVRAGTFVVDTPLPRLRELFVEGSGLVGGAVDGDLGLAPNLECLFAEGRSDLTLLCEGVRDLAVGGASAPTVPPHASIERLRIEGLVDGAQMTPPPNLRWLRASPRRGVAALLRPLARLERLELDLEMASVGRLSLLGPKPVLRDCFVSYGGLQSLAGVGEWRALRHLTLFRPGAIALEPLSESAVEVVEIDGGRAAIELAPLGAIPQLNKLSLDLDVPVESLAFLAAARSLRELQLGETQLGPGALDGLSDVPTLERLSLDSCNAAEAQRFAQLRPDVELRSFQGMRSARPEPDAHVGEVPLSRLGDGAWTIFVDIAQRLGFADNFAAEEAVKARLAAHELSGVEFDTEAGNFSASAASRTQIEAVGRAINELAAQRVH